MKILLLVTAFNSLTQAIYTRLKDDGHTLSITFAIDELQMLREIDLFAPELILSPFLKKYLPKSIYENYPTFIFHPGPRGDRGPNSLEYALMCKTKKWGVVVLKANGEYDGGDVYASAAFDVRGTYKASLYRQEVVFASLSLLDTLFENIKKSSFISQELKPLHDIITQEQRKIDWLRDTTEQIIEKVYLSDSFPGVVDEILGVECYLFGAHKEERLKGEPKEILAKRDGAICLGTKDGALWITHLKEPHRFKLPATYVLKERLKGIKEDRLPLIFEREYETFYEISITKRDSVAYLHFNFHNGAVGSAQAIRLKYAIEYLKDECEVLVLMGGEDFFCNGIHLNILEDSQKQGEDGWANINAMNDLVKSILFADEVLTVVCFKGNAGAGGVFLGLACDYVVAKEGVVLNPHYKTLGLSGSEYHSYTLPKRVGEGMATKLLEECLPISVKYAQEIGMIDELLPPLDYEERLHELVSSKYSDEFLWEKEDYLEKHREKIELFKEQEIEIMHPEFWDDRAGFHSLREAFVYKICPRETPKRLIYTKDKKDA